ncbi:MAG: hypothetical protein ACI9K2_007359, partial [Myxococcota bacterium]
RHTLVTPRAMEAHLGCGETSHDATRAVTSNAATPLVGYFDIEVGRYLACRLTLIASGCTTEVKLETAAVYANTRDGLDSGTVVSFPGTALELTADGVQYGAFADLDADYRYARIGIKVSNDQGSNQEGAVVRLVAQLRSDSV